MIKNKQLQQLKANKINERVNCQNKNYIMLKAIYKTLDNTQEIKQNCLKNILLVALLVIMCNYHKFMQQYFDIII